MRTLIKSLVTVAALGVLATSCVDNEVTFYVEHMKVQPDAPTCVSSAGDDSASSGLIDLAIANSYSGYYYVTNAAMEREAYDSLRAETDGIFVEGAEVYVVDGEGGATIGGSEYYLFNQFIAAETSDIVPAVTVPPAVVEELATQYGCRRAWSYTGTEIYQALEEGASQWPPPSEYYGFIYAVVRFVGHTQGGTEVMTQEYSFLIDLCCNCLIDWNLCNNLCDANCGDPDDAAMCHPGVGSGSGSLWDCRDIGFGRQVDWMQTDAIQDVNDTDSDSDTTETYLEEVYYDCDICGSGD